MNRWNLESPYIQGARTLVLEDEPAHHPICLFLDGQFYRGPIGLPNLAPLGLRAATLTSGTGADRHRDFTCQDSFLRFVTEVVLPSLPEPVTVVVGVSLSGLAVAHLALERPELFPRFIAQSPSAWWNGEALVARVSKAGGCDARGWFSVGTLETETDVRHPPTDMHQVTSQWDAVGRLAEAWGSTATLQPFEGGHDGPGWRRELDTAIRWAAGS